MRLRNANKAEPTLALKPRGDVTRNPKQGYQWPKIGHVNVSDKKTLKKIYIYSFSVPFSSVHRWHQMVQTEPTGRKHHRQAVRLHRGQFRSASFSPQVFFPAHYPRYNNVNQKNHNWLFKKFTPALVWARSEGRACGTSHFSSGSRGGGQGGHAPPT